MNLRHFKRLVNVPGQPDNRIASLKASGASCITRYNKRASFASPPMRDTRVLRRDPPPLPQIVAGRGSGFGIGPGQPMMPQIAIKADRQFYGKRTRIFFSLLASPKGAAEYRRLLPLAGHHRLGAKRNAPKTGSVTDYLLGTDACLNITAVRKLSGNTITAARFFGQPNTRPIIRDWLI